jgi:hypothetical protein
MLEKTWLAHSKINYKQYPVEQDLQLEESNYHEYIERCICNAEQDNNEQFKCVICIILLQYPRCVQVLVVKKSEVNLAIYHQKTRRVSFGSNK